MKLNIAVVAIATFAGLGSAYKGMLKDCSDFSFVGLDGASGRAVMLHATCGGKAQELDINDCFG